MASLRNRLEAAIDNFAAAQASVTQAYLTETGLEEANKLKDACAKVLAKTLEELFDDL